MRPVLFEFGPFRLYGYGVMIVLGGILSFRFLHGRAKEAGLRGDEDFWILVNAILLSGFIGGRMMYVFEYTKWFSAEFWRTLFSISSAFSVLGAFLAVPSGIFVFCRWRDIPFLRLFDVISVMAPFWHAFGRIGCLLAGCCYGRPTSGWGIVFQDPRAMVPIEWRGIPLYPTQLYEAFGNVLIAAALLALLNRTRLSPAGLVTGAYFAAYGTLRFGMETIRGDTVPLSFGLTAGQVLSLALLTAACAFWTARAKCFRPS